MLGYTILKNGDRLQSAPIESVDLFFQFFIDVRDDLLCMNLIKDDLIYVAVELLYNNIFSGDNVAHFLEILKLKLNFWKNKVVNDKTPLVVIGPFVLPILFVLTLVIGRAVL